MAYAAVISLKRTIERLINPTNPQITESAYKELELLRNTLRRLDYGNNRRVDRSVISALDEQIKEAVWKLEDVLQSYVLHHSMITPVDEKDVKQEIYLFMTTVKMLKANYCGELDCSLLREEDDDDDDHVSPIDSCDGNKPTTMTVGLSDQFEKIRNELLNWQYGSKIISLVGMAGIGKTHLARRIYHDPVIVRYFHLTLWVRLGPKYKDKNVLVDIVAQVERKPKNLYMGKSLSELKELLENSLRGRIYLIVLDDIWSTQVCDTLKWWLPENQNGRRFLLTTRLEQVAKHPTTTIHHICFLNNEESWNLLLQNVFVDKCCPPQLEKAGRKIAEKCEGLPLLILAVADILCGHEKTEEYWNKVVDKKTTTFTDAYEKISEVLYSSYEYLPQQLKPCFLYMGVFPQSFKIPLPKLIHLWTIEDFLGASDYEDLEDFAMKCLEGLVSNSLAIICKKSSNHKIKSSKLHSAYWYLCVKEARKIKFFHVLEKLTDGSKDYIENQRRLSVQNNILFGIKEAYDSMAATLTARSLLCTGPDHEYPVPICFNLMLLKVLDALAIRFYEFPNEVVKLLQLRYLALTHNGKVPSSISKLQQLQCLIVRQHHNIRFLRDSTCLPKEVSEMQQGRITKLQRDPWPKKLWDMRGLKIAKMLRDATYLTKDIRHMQQVMSTKFLQDSTYLPKEIWDMREMRHLRIMGSNLPDPSSAAELPNLLTLHVNARSCTNGVFRSIPNLKKLGLKIELQPDGAETLSCFEHIGLLYHLESLKCVVVNPRLRSQVVAPPDDLSNLPRCLKKLSLNGLGYSWKFMSSIGSLPNLKVLKLRCNAFQGPQWETNGIGFWRLEFLLLEDIDLVHWETDRYYSFALLQIKRDTIGNWRCTNSKND